MTSPLQLSPILEENSHGNIAARIPQLVKPPVYHHPPTEPTPFQRLVLILGSASAVAGALCFAFGLGFDNFYFQLIGYVLAPTGASLFFVFLCLYQTGGRSLKDPLIVEPVRPIRVNPRIIGPNGPLRQTSLLLANSGSSQRLSVVNERSCEVSTGSSCHQPDLALKAATLEVANAVTRTIAESLKEQSDNKCSQTTFIATL